VDNVLLMGSQLFEAGAVDEVFISASRELFESLLDEVHEDALVLAEGFGFPELFMEKKSAIANADGKIYENLMWSAKKFGMLNQFDIHPTMLEYIKEQKKIQSHRAKL